MNVPQQPPRSPRALLRNPREDQIPEGPVEVVVSLDDNRRANIVFGLYDQNIAHIERRLGVIATVNGNRVTVRGDMLGTDQAKRVIDSLYELARRQLELSTGDVDGMIAEARAQGILFPPEQISAEETGFAEINTRKRRIRARNAAQNDYLRALRKHELIFAEGPAGTGKTWLAVGHAVSLIERLCCSTRRKRPPRCR